MKARAYRYSRWDGSQDINLKWKALTDELMDLFLEAGDFPMAMEWLFRQGFNLELQKELVTGLNKMISELMKLRRKLLGDFSLSNLGVEFRKELNKIIEMEKDALQQELEQTAHKFSITRSEALKQRIEELFHREAFLNRLPHKIKDALESLKDYRWTSPQAEQHYKKLLDTIRKIKDFASQNWFNGLTPLTIEQALEIIDRIQRINRLLELLDQNKIEKVNLDDIEEFLGTEARRSLEAMLEFTEFLLNAGLIHRTDEGFDITAKAAQRIGKKALSEIYTMVSRHQFGTHTSPSFGAGSILPDSSKPYEYGDPFNIDLKGTLMASIQRQALEGKTFDPPIKMHPQDMQVNKMDFSSSSSTVLLLDMSLSMIREGRFGSAKKVAIALDNLVRNFFPRDKLHVVGFATVARELKGKELLKASGNPAGDIFTNIQDALRLAMKLLASSPAGNRQIILITDGQPTAYTSEGKLHIEWPMFGVSPNANRETLKEVKKVTSFGAVINTFMLDNSPALVHFVNEMTRINRGRAFFTTPRTLGKYLLVDYIERKKKMVH